MIDQQLQGSGVPTAEEIAAKRATWVAYKKARNAPAVVEGGKVNWKKAGKTALKVGKLANNLTKKATGQSLSDLAIEYAVENSIQRIDPSGGIASEMLEAQLQKAANKKIDKRGGQFLEKRRRHWCSRCG